MDRQRLSGRERICSSEFGLRPWIAEFQIRQGAQFFRGTVAPNFGKPGGGVQFFVPNLKDLVKLQ